MNAIAIRVPEIYLAPAGLFRAVLIASCIALVLSAAIGVPLEDGGPKICRPFTIGVSAIGGPDPIEGCHRPYSGARIISGSAPASAGASAGP